MPGDIDNVAEAARQVYEQKLRASLEANHMHEFVAIEPVSGEFFLGQTLSEAIGASRTKYPDRLAHAMRVGHKAAIHFGMHVRADSRTLLSLRETGTSSGATLLSLERTGIR